MSKKRTSSEFNNDEETTEGSDPVLHEEDNAKRVKLDPWIDDTTLQDLPIELLEYILVKIVVQEVITMKAKKSAWKEKADMVISRLRTVSLQWSSILTTNFFLNEVHRLLDATGQPNSHLSVSFECPVRSEVLALSTMLNLVFMLRRCNASEFSIHVYARNVALDIAKVIPLPNIVPEDIASCGISGSIFILSKEGRSRAVHRIRSPDVNNRTSLWISNLRIPMSTMSVDSYGRVIIASQLEEPKRGLVTLFHPDGVVQRRLEFSADVYGFDNFDTVLSTPSRNLVVSVRDTDGRRIMIEVNEAGETLRRYASKLPANCAVSMADGLGTVIVCGSGRKVELLDKRFTPLKVTGDELLDGKFTAPMKMAYNPQTNELIRVSEIADTSTTFVTVFKFVED